MADATSGFDNGNPIVFTYYDTYDNDDNQVDVLTSFMQQFGADDSGFELDFYPLTRLFYTLRKELHARRLADDIPNENFANVFLSRDPYDSIGGISCSVS